MPLTESYRDLIVWQRAMELAEFVYRITAQFPRAERYALVSQMRKAAASVPSNIAEGSRQRRVAYRARVRIALGEHAELETQAELAWRLGYLTEEDRNRFERLSAEVGRLAHGLRRSLRQPPNP